MCEFGPSSSKRRPGSDFVGGRGSDAYDESTAARRRAGALATQGVDASLDCQKDIMRVRSLPHGVKQSSLPTILTCIRQSI